MTNHDPPVPATSSSSASAQTQRDLLREEASNILTEGEEILAVSAQTGLSRLWLFKSDGIVVTNERMLFLSRGLFSFHFEDFHWEHVQNVHFEDTLFGARVSVEAYASDSGYTKKATGESTVETDRGWLISEQAQKVYSVAQKLEQDWRQRRRRRMMQEQQAEKGHVVVDSPDTDNIAVDDDLSFERRIEKLKKMRDEDLISDTEFEQKKQELLDSI